MGVQQAVLPQGPTPVVAVLHVLGALLHQILGKAEFLNPGGSVKDRVALRIIQEALVSRCAALCCAVVVCFTTARHVAKAAYAVLA